MFQQKNLTGPAHLAFRFVDEFRVDHFLVRNSHQHAVQGTDPGRTESYAFDLTFHRTNFHLVTDTKGFIKKYRK